MEHIFQYKQKMMATYVLGEMLDQMICKTFAFILSRPTLTWFYKFLS